MAPMEVCDIDKSLLTKFSRMELMLGKEGLAALLSSAVLVIGANGVGSEIVKNLMLSGVRRVSLHDNGKVDESDLGTQAFVASTDLGTRRAAAVVARMSGLRDGSDLVEVSENVTEEIVSQHSVVVATAGDEAALVALDASCRKLGVPFILATCRGAFARVFCDFGPSFYVADPSGEPLSVAMLESVSQESPAVTAVTTAGERGHGLQEGDSVRFWGVGGMGGELEARGPIPITVTGNYSFDAHVDAASMGAYTGGGYVTQVRAGRTEAFRPLGESLERPEFGEASGAARSATMHLAYRASEDGEGGAMAAAERLAPPGSLDDEARAAVARVAAAGGQLLPVAASAGAVAAGEAVKAITHQLSPLRQWMYIDGGAALPGEGAGGGGAAMGGGGQGRALGAEAQRRLAGMKLLVVGLGGVGCEVVKNLAAMGVGTADEGSVTLMDEASVFSRNLPRSVLFRAGDVGRTKAAAAAEAAHSLNEDMEVTAMPYPLNGDTVAFLGEDGISGLDAVVCAADSVAARLFADERCVAGRTALVDGGAMGAKGSVQVVVPHQSEQWSRSSDPAERTFPTCVVRNFPYQTEHAVAWARDLYDSLYTSRPRDVNAYLEGGAEKLLDAGAGHRANPAAALGMVRDSLGEHRPLSFQACVEWARRQFEDSFSNAVKQLLHSFPVDMRTAAGGLFWGGTKRPPTPLRFDAADSLHMDFVVAASNLQAMVYGLKGSRDTAYFTKVLGAMVVPEFVPQDGVQIATTDAEVKREAEAASRAGGAGGPGGDGLEDCEHLLKDLPMPSSLAGYRLVPLPFEEEESSAAEGSRAGTPGGGGGPAAPLEFVLAAANLRARCYGIPPGDAAAVRQVAAGAGPGLVTTASLVAGLACLEVCKLATGDKPPLSAFRNTFFNLARPFVGECEPVAVERFTVATALGKALEWTLWDRLEVDARGCTLEAFLAKFQKEQGLEVSMVSYGKSLLYAEFLNPKRMKERLMMPLVQVLETVSKVPLAEGQEHVRLSVGCLDPSGDDAEVPDVVARVA